MTTYLTVKCLDGHIYRAYHVAPDHQNVMYCMYCGSQHISVEVNPEWDVVDVLAKEYTSTPDKIRRALAVWELEVLECRAAHTVIPSFKEFMTGTPL